ncbi:DNA-directed RNA polymerase subunit beta [Enterococcus olivae]
MQTNRYMLTSVIKVLLVILLAMILFLAGLMVGYGIIGDGSPFQVFNRDLWHHILEFVK